MGPWERKWRVRCSLKRLQQIRRRTNRNLTYLCSWTDTTTFWDCSTAQRNQLMADLSAAEAARQDAVTRTTHKNQARVWRWWKIYANSIGITDDFYLDGLKSFGRIKLMGAFAMALREGRFSGPAHDSLVQGTIRNTIPMWLRPSRRTIDPTQPRTKMTSLEDFYRGSTDPLETDTQPRNSRKPYPAVSFEK